MYNSHFVMWTVEIRLCEGTPRMILGISTCHQAGSQVIRNAQYSYLVRTNGQHQGLRERQAHSRRALV